MCRQLRQDIYIDIYIILYIVLLSDDDDDALEKNYQLNALIFISKYQFLVLFNFLNLLKIWQKKVYAMHLLANDLFTRQFIIINESIH